MLQGQKIPRKILPKSQKRVYVGFEDGSKSVKYYNADTRKILTSRNYCFLSNIEKAPPEEIVVAPNLPREGELTESTPPMGSDSRKRKRDEEESPEKQDNEYVSRTLMSQSVAGASKQNKNKCLGVLYEA